MSKPDISIEELWPHGSFQVKNGEKRLFDLLEELIIWLSYNDTRMMQQEVVGWLVSVRLGK